MVDLRGFVLRRPDADAVTRRSPDREAKAGLGPAAHVSDTGSEGMHACRWGEVQPTSVAKGIFSL